MNDIEKRNLGGMSKLSPLTIMKISCIWLPETATDAYKDIRFTSTNHMAVLGAVGILPVE